MSKSQKFVISVLALSTTGLASGMGSLPIKWTIMPNEKLCIVAERHAYYKKWLGLRVVQGGFAKGGIYKFNGKGENEKKYFYVAVPDSSKLASVEINAEDEGGGSHMEKFRFKKVSERNAIYYFNDKSRMRHGDSDYNDVILNLRGASTCESSSVEFPYQSHPK